jgi:type III pantothenate kinase
VLDIGNTKTKVAVFNSEELVESCCIEQISGQYIKQISRQYKFIDKAILSTVKDVDTNFIEFLKKEVNYFLEIDSNTPLPIKNLYKSPKTLGKDRLAAIVGAFNIFPGNNVLVVDAGTAITFDILTSKGEYIGGNISPGIDTRFRALNEFTGRLPRLKRERIFPDIGYSTESAVISGVQWGVIYEIEAYIAKFSKKYKDLKIILTGGDADFFDRKLKNPIFVISNLILIGLNKILLYNEKKD